MEEGITDWHYEMIFSENFFTIDSGQVKHLDKNGEVVRVSKFGKNHIEAPLVYKLDLEEQIKKKIGQEMAKNDICTICNEDVKNPVYPSCNHKCCKNCLIKKVSLEAFLNKCPICQRKIFLSCTNDREGKPLLKRRAKIWGNIFVQKRWYDMYDDGESSAGDNESLGYASYHFEEEKSYISYSSAPASWTLSDGSKPPDKKFFENLNFDESTRTITASIFWEDNPFNGDIRWDYTLKFSEDFTTIESGFVHGYGKDDDEDEILDNGKTFFGGNPETTLRYFAYEGLEAKKILEN